MNKFLWTLMVAIGILFAWNATADATVKFCLEYDVEFVDSSYESGWDCGSHQSPPGSNWCEDDWQSDDSYALRGVYVQITKSGSSVFSGYTDDGLGSDGVGCTPALDPPGSNTGTYYLTVYSNAKVRGNYI